MANYFARKTGNINATDVWATTPSGTAGAQTFVSGDVLYANSFTITVNVDTNLGSTGEVRNDNTNGATAGGTFTLSNGVTLTANCFASSTGTACVTLSSGSATITGNCTGGSVSNADGARNAGTGTLTITGNCTGGSGGSSVGASNNSTGTLTITGNCTGGSGGSGAYGANNASTGTLTITGNCTGGSGGNSAHGAHNNSTGTLTITGNCTGGSAGTADGARNASTGTLTINGTATGGTQAFGANNNSTGTLNVTRAKGNDFGIGTTGRTLQAGVNGAQASFTYVREIEFGDLGCAPITGNIMLTDSTANVCLFYRYGSTKKTLTDPAATVDYPANADVRSGTVFANGNRTGTCAVPAASSVAAGVAVGSGVGTAVLTQANVWDYALSSASSVAGSVGQKLAKAASTTDVIAFA